MVAKRFVAERNDKCDEETTGVHVCHQLIPPQQRFVAKQYDTQHDEETMTLHEVKQKNRHSFASFLQSDDNATRSKDCMRCVVK